MIPAKFNIKEEINNYIQKIIKDQKDEKKHICTSSSCFFLILSLRNKSRTQKFNKTSYFSLSTISRDELICVIIRRDFEKSKCSIRFGYFIITLGSRFKDKLGIIRRLNKVQFMELHVKNRFRSIKCKQRSRNKFECNYRWNSEVIFSVIE